jgi:hypothetical protein
VPAARPAAAAASTRATTAPGRGGGDGAPPSARRYRAERRSPARATLLIVGAVVVAVIVIVAVVLSLGGGGSKAGSSTSNAGAASSTGGNATTTAHGAKGSSATKTAGLSPARTEVVVLNGTGTTGLAHRVSGELQQHGYSKATALDGQPPGTNQTTVVEYSSGHRSEAQSVATAIGAGTPQPVEGTVAAMADSAPVVVIVGLDKTSASP